MDSKAIQEFTDCPSGHGLQLSDLPMTPDTFVTLLIGGGRANPNGITVSEFNILNYGLCSHPKLT